MSPRLLHFSEDPGIVRFEPRPVSAPATRPPGEERLSGPLVWAIDDWHSPMYLFPRECPRILAWAVESTTAGDRATWLGRSEARMIAHIEWAWLERLCRAVLYRYELPRATFEDLHDAGMFVSRQEVDPLDVTRIDDLPAALREAGVELRVMPLLLPLKGAWESTMHVSGIRLRNAAGWT